MSRADPLFMALVLGLGMAGCLVLVVGLFAVWGLAARVRAARSRRRAGR